MTGSPTDYGSLTAVILATFSPLLAFLLIMIRTRSHPRLSAGVSLGAVSISLACSIFLLILHRHMEAPIQFTARWLTATTIEAPFGFLLDPLNLVMLVVVATICFLVQVYSLGYMEGDPGFSRYYAYMSLFAWAMTSLVVSPTILQLYIFWELVGLSSYLLIGFWYEKFSATQAGKKAFVMTRVGDVAFFLGLFTVFLHLGNFSILELNGPEAARRMSPAVITLASILIFGGIAGKSAQFPLLTWLPDAMEGPTPVSALLHSATMVAAGVYLFARLFPFFSLSSTAMTVFLAIGTVSMILASTMAMVDRDIKKVWAYSTISQLGYMIMALGAGGYAGYFGGFFHLTTHAGFKSLLFLCSGVYIHHYETNDFFDLGREGARSFKVPTVALVIAAAALAGLPPFSGFFSKEAVLGSLAALSNPLWLGAALFGVFLTAYYAFRVVFGICLPRKREKAPETAAGPPDPRVRPRDVSPESAETAEVAGHAAPYGVTAWPLGILATATVLLGFIERPLNLFLTGGAEPGASRPIPVEAGLPWVPYAALGLAVLGLALAWFEFGRRGAAGVGFVERIKPLYALFSDRWYIDRAYAFLLNRVVDSGFSALFYANDTKVIDGGIDEMCKGTVEGGRVVSVLNSATIQYRLLGLFAVLAFLSLYFLF